MLSRGKSCPLLGRKWGKAGEDICGDNFYSGKLEGFKGSCVDKVTWPEAQGKLLNSVSFLIAVDWRLWTPCIWTCGGPAGKDVTYHF